MISKLLLSLLLIALMPAVSVNAQVEKTIYDANRAIDNVTKGTEAINKIGSMFKKKKTTKPGENNADTLKKTIAAPAKDSGNKTIITIAGIEFQKLVLLETNIEACEGVTEAKKKFSATTSSIEVSHSNSTEELLALILLTCKDIFNESNIENYEEGKISIRFK